MPAACGALVPRRMVQARHSFLPSVRKLIRPSYTLLGLIRLSRPEAVTPISARKAAFSSGE